jgi:hypothetical protein
VIEVKVQVFGNTSRLSGALGLFE